MSPMPPAPSSIVGNANQSMSVPNVRSGLTSSEAAMPPTNAPQQYISAEAPVLNTLAMPSTKAVASAPSVPPSTLSSVRSSPNMRSRVLVTDSSVQLPSELNRVS